MLLTSLKDRHHILMNDATSLVKEQINILEAKFEYQLCSLHLHKNLKVLSKSTTLNHPYLQALDNLGLRLIYSG